MRAENEQIPAQFTRTLGKIYNQLHNQLPFIFNHNHRSGNSHFLAKKYETYLYPVKSYQHQRINQMQSGEDDISAFLFCADQAMKNACFSASDKELGRNFQNTRKFRMFF